MNKEDDSSAANSSRFELICAAVMAIFASVGVLSSTYSGITGAGWLNGSQVASQAYFWYQAKSIKETIIAGQRDFLLSLKDTFTTKKQNASIDSYVKKINKDINRLTQEKYEILMGSKNIDKSKWVQDIDGKYGQVIGAKEWDEVAAQYGTSSDSFTYATVYLQLALVIGALTIMITYLIPRYFFFAIMIGFGCYGTYLCWQGYALYSTLNL
ncbi:DUF4337 family protein [Legionella sp. km772]|uniref:DUF4337 family protein n=1 Tax=Legionella sp. km772 TaxID=2498111 RepID=UPI000F8CEE61|nr:DUF4337 family protein [Legionella sp. km772]RUR13006.1 DUF4337 family protein [Legionella sp. km772]